jgi:hypothetical protein
MAVEARGVIEEVLKILDGSAPPHSGGGAG